MKEEDRSRARDVSLGGSPPVPPLRSLAANAITAVLDPVVAILLLAGLFDGISGNPVDSILLFTVAVALGRDAVLRRRGVPDAHADRSRAPLAAAAPGWWPLAFAAAMVYAVVIGGFGRYSWPLTVAVTVPGAFVLAAAWRGPLIARPDPAPLDLAGAVAWASLFVGLGLWELAALLLQPSLTTDSYAHPTISVLTDPILATHPGRSIFLLSWLAFGWFLMQQ